jgi:cyclic pyranopterin phosphate synthase
MALDRFGRKIHYLRISLTDRCNLRCLYCIPEGTSYKPVNRLMQDDEILRLVRLFACLGFDKIRLTGGEPTLRANLVGIVDSICHLPGIQAVSMTTNGILLAPLAKPLAAAGLQRVNISIDTLDPVKFKCITCSGNLEDVWEGIMSAERAGLQPIKLNVVVVRGCNEPDVVNLASLTINHAWQVRFIEMMPFGRMAGLQTTQSVTAGETRERIEQALGSLVPVNNNDQFEGEARLFRLPGATGTIGFINSITAPFCGSCNRARITADGFLRMCLLHDYEVDLLTPMRNGASQDELRNLVLDAIYNKPWGQGLAESEIPLFRVLNEIGG